MKVIFKLWLVVFLGAFVPGCASHPPASAKTGDSRMEAPAEADTGSQTEVHGYISTSVSARIK